MPAYEPKTQTRDPKSWFVKLQCLLAKCLSRYMVISPSRGSPIKHPNTTVLLMRTPKRFLPILGNIPRISQLFEAPVQLYYVLSNEHAGGRRTSSKGGNDPRKKTTDGTPVLSCSARVVTWVSMVMSTINKKWHYSNRKPAAVNPHFPHLLSSKPLIPKPCIPNLKTL